MPSTTANYPAFYACGRAVLWRGVWQSDAAIEHFVGLFKDACEAAFRAGDLEAYDQASRCLNEVRDAREAARAWRSEKTPVARAA